MADDSLDIIELFDFHPCNTPRGMLHYDLRQLPSETQTKINQLKINTVREDEKYLAKHPEIRAVVAMITNHVLHNRPRKDLPSFVGQLFCRSRIDIENDLKPFFREEPYKYEGDSAVGLNKQYLQLETERSSILNFEQQCDEESCLSNAPKEVLDEIIEKAFKQLKIDESQDECYIPTYIDENVSIVNQIINEILNKIVKETSSDVVTLFSGKTTKSSSIATMSDLRTDAESNFETSSTYSEVISPKESER